MNGSNRLARYLRTLGVQPDTLVGVAMERSEEMLVGLLGDPEGRWGLRPVGSRFSQGSASP